MLSLIRRVAEFFFTEEEIYDNEDEDIESDHVLARKCQFSNKHVSPPEPSTKSEDQTRRRGTVTYISPEYGLIDESYYFPVDIVPRSVKLRVGDTVEYVAYRAKENEAERVVRIESLRSSDWDDDDDDFGKDKAEEKSRNDDEVVERTERVLSGKVIGKKGNEVFIEPLNICCNLNYLGSGFTPVKGDWVSLQAEVAVDPDAINKVGKILSVRHMKPLRTRVDVGNITLARKGIRNLWNCIIENEVHFSTEYCSIKFTPQLGQQVRYRAVESDQGNCTWRAVYVESLEGKNGDSTTSCVGKGIDDIVITGDTRFGPMETDATAESALDVRNVGNIPYVLSNVSFQCGRSKSQLSLLSPKNAVTLNPGDSVKLVFECRARFLGTSVEGVVLRFGDFQIEKSFRIEVGVDEDMRKLMETQTGSTRPISDTRRRLTWRMFDTSDAVHGTKLFLTPRFRKGVRRTTYCVPDDLMKIVLSESGEYNISEIKRNILEYAPQLKQELCEGTYCSRFHTLLHLEEIEEKVLFRRYDLFGVILRRRGEYLALDLFDLVDAKFHIRHGVSVVVTQPWSESNPVKQIGYVHEVHETEIYISFQTSFHESYNETVCDVTFQPMRSNFIKFHNAVEMAATRLGLPWLFPSVVKEKPSLLELNQDIDDNNEEMLKYQYDEDADGYLVPKQVKPQLKWFNEKLNERQRLAVLGVLEGKGRPLPYVVFGPPGTGKTLTLLEIVLQIHHHFSDSRILIATPSNSAADLICESLIATGKFLPGQMIRVLSHIRASRGDVPENIVPYCTTVEEEGWSRKSSTNLQNIRSCGVNDCVGAQRIVIGTCSAVGIFQSFVEERSHHFSHVVIDEAGQATEPEAMVPISFADLHRGRVILCGDPEQLGPLCMSHFARTLGLRTSFLERVTKSSPYARNSDIFPATGYDPNYITRLNINYRSVPEILKLPSQMFYNSELIANVSQSHGVEADIIRRFPWAGSGRNTPPAIIFHGLDGENKRDDNSYSWYNPLEAWQSVCYLKRLYNMDLTPDDVGIITPYQKQVEKLRLLLTALNVPSPKVGSVEEFQGQERQVIILTTVRSSSDVCDTTERCLGFLASPRRLNVAITRARAILIIVGNPFTLSLDPYWRNVIQYCVTNDSYTGCSIDRLL